MEKEYEVWVKWEGEVFKFFKGYDSEQDAQNTALKIQKEFPALVRVYKVSREEISYEKGYLIECIRSETSSVRVGKRLRAQIIYNEYNNVEFKLLEDLPNEDDLYNATVFVKGSHMPKNGYLWSWKVVDE